MGGGGRERALLFASTRFEIIPVNEQCSLFVVSKIFKNYGKWSIGYRKMNAEEWMNTSSWFCILITISTLWKCIADLPTSDFNDFRRLIKDIHIWENEKFSAYRNFPSCSRGNEHIPNCFKSTSFLALFFVNIWQTTKNLLFITLANCSMFHAILFPEIMEDQKS